MNSNRSELERISGFIHPRLAVILHDLGMVWLAWIVAHYLRYEFGPGQLPFNPFSLQVGIVVLVQGLVFWWMGLYRGLWRFASIPDIWNIVRSSVLGTLAVTLALVLLTRIESTPRSVLMIFPALLIVFLSAPRLLYRFWKDSRLDLYARKPGERVLILGAGRSADMLVRELRREHSYRVVGFLDDRKRLQGAKLQGHPVLGSLDQLDIIAAEVDAKKIIIAMPSASDDQMRRAVELCEQTKLPFLTLPKLQDMVESGGPSLKLREVRIEDLLGRAAVKLDWNAMQEDLGTARIMVTGGGGSIGSELCRQLAQLKPAHLTVFDRDEHALYEIDRELRRDFPELDFNILLGDVGDQVSVDYALSQTRADVIYHAAAYKHVPMLQDRIREAVKNNILGTQTLAKAAIRHKVRKFVLISTDKAVNPGNIMGATKRVAEMYCQSLGAESQTRFVTVRFGNVLNSAGSVVPLFQEQIRKGGPVTVTHPDISRYFMTIPEACQLIMQSSIQGQGGEIFVLDMGEPVKISYLAEQLIRLSGKSPDKDIKIQFTGLRAGEKLYEELFNEGEKYASTSHEKILLARHGVIKVKVIVDALSKMQKMCDEYEETELLGLLYQLVPGMGDTARTSSRQVIKLPVKNNKVVSQTSNNDER